MCAHFPHLMDFLEGPWVSRPNENSHMQTAHKTPPSLHLLSPPSLQFLSLPVWGLSRQNWLSLPLRACLSYKGVWPARSRIYLIKQNTDNHEIYGRMPTHQRGAGLVSCVICGCLSNCKINFQFSSSNMERTWRTGSRRGTCSRENQRQEISNQKSETWVATTTTTTLTTTTTRGRTSCSSSDILCSWFWLCEIDKNQFATSSRRT